MKDSNFGQYFAEFFGIFFFTVIGFGTVAVLVTDPIGLGLSFSWLAAGWGLAVALAIFITAGISGAHLNPAVTISLAVFGGFDKRKVIPYIIAQILGAFAAAALVAALFWRQFAALNMVADFSTGAAPGVTLPIAFFTELVLTFMLMMVIYSVTDGNNPAAPKFGLGVICIGVIIIVGGMTLGTLTGFAMNPARDLGPRIFAALAGGGFDATYALVAPVLGTIVGALLAGGVYKGILVNYYPKAMATAQDEVWEVNEASKEEKK